MTRILICLVVMGLTGLGAAGCAWTTQPIEYHDDRDEKPGPRLFTGEEGGFIIYGEAREKKEGHKASKR